MAKTLDANQTQKIDRLYNRPVYFCHLLLNGLTLYFSDRCFKYNSIDYEDYLFDLSAIGNEVANLGGYDNARTTLRFKNSPIRAKNTLIELFDDYPPEKRYVEIYKLMWDPGETFGSDASTKIFKGEMGQPYDVLDPPVDFSIDCSLMLFGKNVSLPLDVIDLADFPSADPDDVGKFRNIPIGSMKKLVCPWTVAGWVSTITADETSSDTTIEVSDATGAPATPFTAIIDAEQVRVTSKTGNSFTVTRGYGGTTAVAHNKGAVIYEQRADFEVEVSKSPVKSIGDIYVKRYDDWVRVVSGATAYASSGGRAKIVFSDRVKLEEKTNQVPINVIDEGSHPHAADEGAHAHAADESVHAHAILDIGFSKKDCIPTSASGFTNSGNAVDGNDDSYATGDNTDTLTVGFTESNLGTINRQYIWVRASTTTGNIYCGATLVGSISTDPGATPGTWFRFIKNGGSWGDNVQIVGVVTTACIHEVYKEVEYSPAAITDNRQPSVTVNTHAASGISATTHAATDVDVSTTLGGNSVANMLIGDLVACDVEGIPDDGSGTYTGTPSALIERPDHVRKYILMGLLGFAAGDIDTSFGTVGTTYAGRIAGGYKLAFNLPDVATEAMDLFRKIDEQTRSNMFESQGKFKLAFNSTSDPASQLTFSKDNIVGSFRFNKTEIVDVRNRIRGHYFRDYSKSGSLGQAYRKVNEKSDATSIAKYGELQEDLEFDCVGDLSTMVDDVLDWFILRKKDVRKVVEFTAKWEAMILDHCDHFTVTATFWTGLKFKTLLLLELPDRQGFQLKGEQFISS